VTETLDGKEILPQERVLHARKRGTNVCAVAASFDDTPVGRPAADGSGQGASGACSAGDDDFCIADAPSSTPAPQPSTHMGSMPTQAGSIGTGLATSNTARAAADAVSSSNAHHSTAHLRMAVPGEDALTASASHMLPAAPVMSHVISHRKLNKVHCSR